MRFDLRDLVKRRPAATAAVILLAFSLAALILFAARPPAHPGPPLTMPGQGPGPIVARPSETGELWRQSVYAADGKTVLEERVAYADGRMGSFFFDDNGRPVRYFCRFPVADKSAGGNGAARGEDDASGDSIATYEATFTQGGKLVEHAVEKRADGSTASVYNLHADGSEVVRRFRKDGTLESMSIAYSDGSRRTASFSDDGKSEVGVAFIGPDQKTVRLPDAGASASSSPSASSSTAPCFLVRLTGARVSGWDYVDEYGEVRQTALYLADGSLEFTFFNEYGTATHRQIWRLQGRDWQRGYYALDRVIEFFDDGTSVFRELSLSADEKTVRLSRLYREDGTLWEVRHYDGAGNGLMTDHFDYDGKYSYTSYPSWWSWSELVDESLLTAPGDDFASGLGLRLKGGRFAWRLKDGDLSIDPQLIVRAAP